MEKVYEPIKIENLKDMLNRTKETHKDNSAYKVRGETNGEYKIITHGEFRELIDCLGTMLINMGLKDKRIAVIGENRYEWGIAYLATCCGTGVVVPLDRSLPDNEIEELLIRSEAECIFYTSTYDDAMKDIKNDNKTNVKHFISMDLKESTKEVYSLTKLIEEGKKILEARR